MLVSLEPASQQLIELGIKQNIIKDWVLISHD